MTRKLESSEPKYELVFYCDTNYNCGRTTVDVGTFDEMKQSRQAFYRSSAGQFVTAFIEPVISTFRYMTKIVGSDRRAFEIVNCVNEKLVLVRELDARMNPDWKPEFKTGGFSGHVENQDSQRWMFSINEQNPLINVRLQRDLITWVDRHRNHYIPTVAPEAFYDYNY